MDCYLCVRTFLEELGMDLSRLPDGVADMDMVMKERHSITALKESLIRLFEETMLLRDSQTASKYSQVLEEARAFIRGNYAREDISLNTVAALSLIHILHGAGPPGFMDICGGCKDKGASVHQ